MAIYIRCTKCKCDHTLDSKICRKCGSTLGIKKKYKVVVKTPKGNRVVRLVDTLSLAKRVENSFKGKIAEKRLLGITKAPFISDIWDKYFIWAKSNKKSWYDDETRWNKHVKEKVANKRMDQLVGHDIQKILDGMVKDKNDLTKKHAPATIKQVLVLIKRVYNWANDQDLYDGKNPAAKIEPPKVQNEVTECLSESELEKLLKIIDDWKIPLNALVVKFALYTGFRRGEILTLKWRDIEGDIVSLRDPKGKPAKIPVGNEAVKIIHQAKELAPRDDSPYVFPNTEGNQRKYYQKTWKWIRKKAGLPKGFRFHDLRHTFASYLASSGEVDLYTLQRLLNHQTPQMTQRYAHLRDDILRKGASVGDKVLSVKR